MIRQQIQFAAPPAAVFDALIQSDKHAAFTGAPAVISDEDGGAWSAYGGAIAGRHIELVRGERIVQAWRPGNWPAGSYSLVSIALASVDGGTQLTLEHTGYPADQEPHLAAGWQERYWSPLAAWL
jgi:activator of HSP90 ATPase